MRDTKNVIRYHDPTERGTMKKNRTILYFMMAGFLVFALADVLLIHMQVRSYKEKIQILSAFTQEQGEENLDLAVRLLKGKENFDKKDGQKVLESYGYLKSGSNRYNLELRKEIGIILCLSFVMFMLYLVAVIRSSKRLVEKKRQELKNLEKILGQFRKRMYELDAREEYQGRDIRMNRIYEQLELLGEMLVLDEERLAADKEATKSLVTDISHQLKTPVAGLKTCFEILMQEDLSEEEQVEFREQCRRQLQGLEAMTSALVNISRMETGMIQIKKEPADILETLIAAINRVYLKAEEKQISIEFQEEEDFGSLEILHDVKWVCEALINILENAIKYSQSHTVISIRMIKCIGFLRIEIQDQGIGIPKGEYHKIFKRFYRGTSMEVAQTQGSGVGLYLTREILGEHGGSVTVSSRCHGGEQGSTFVVQLPYESRSLTKL